MRIAVLGTGSVGRALAAKFAALDHQVTIGTRDVAATLAGGKPDPQGSERFPVWQNSHPEIGLATFADAAADAELLVNASSGSASLRVLAAAGPENLDGKVLIDVANPLDLSHGFPPRLDPVNIDSLGEQIQRAFPTARVVKTLCTMNAAIMVDPTQIGGADHTVFLSGDDDEAKQIVGALLQEIGWHDILDLGGIRTARGQEMLIANWLSIYAALGTADFNVKIVR